MTGSYGGTFLAAQYANCARSIEKITLDACELDCNALQRVGRYGFIFDVQDGFVTNCVLRMYNKTAFVGWYPANDAQVTFQSNTVYGGKFAGGNPVFVLKPTRGAPLIGGKPVHWPGSGWTIIAKFVDGAVRQPFGDRS